MNIPIGTNHSGEVVTLGGACGLVSILGMSGTGKSKVVEKMASALIEQGAGGILIDPFGDIASAVLKQVSKSRRLKVATFRVRVGTAKENVARFAKEIHFSEMKKDAGKFLLCTLDYPTVGAADAREIGIAILGRFSKTVGSSGRAVVVDEASNFVETEKLAAMMGDRKKTLWILANTTLNRYKDSDAKAVVRDADSLISLRVDKRTAGFVSADGKVGAKADTLAAQEKFRMTARLAGMKKPMALSVVYP